MMVKVLRKPSKIYQALKNGNGIANMGILELGSGDATDHRKGRFHHGSKACLITYSHLRNPVTTIIMETIMGNMGNLNKSIFGGAPRRRAAGHSVK
ncbi:MAG: hypothetical protein PHN90_06315 [Methanothrix sp.]|jgi:hypothetical protein|nr:hypothetical protein [Methanothrix sp.]OPX82876.1 MAG: hypothetical protein A4E50_00077 [Methanosaeta sp. PtaB.Bin087]NLX38125.1 hypothetical protein [Methanothrix sp.]HNR58519.1 hypothetical protein [Methanothrix sp.]HOI70302.1 hypothetical protein [Methanothrix sp.]